MNGNVNAREFLKLWDESRNATARDESPPHKKKEFPDSASNRRAVIDGENPDKANRFDEKPWGYAKFCKRWINSGKRRKDA